MSNILIGRANQQEVVLILNRTQVAQFVVTLVHWHLHWLDLPSWLNLQLVIRTTKTCQASPKLCIVYPGEVFFVPILC